MNKYKSISFSKRDNVDTLIIENASARAEISMFGGHILSFIPKHDNRDRLWVSNKAIFDNKTPIRGGIPICWPWFSDVHRQNDPSLPSHGFARTQIWTLTDVKESETSTEVTLKPTQTSGPGMQYDLNLQLNVVVGSKMEVSLKTSNLDERDVLVNCALHSYFRIKDVNTVSLTGIEGKYKDKTLGGGIGETTRPYTILGETDRIHLTNAKLVTIDNQEMTTHVVSDGHDSIVVWNPWRENCLKMKDMEENSYQTMLCVESAVTQPMNIGSGESHLLRQVIE